MPVVTVTTEVSFDVAALDDDVIKAEFNRRSGVKQWAHDHWKSKLPPEKALSDFTNDEILDEMEEREIEHPQLVTIERVYRLMAEHEIDAAMDELSREFGLSFPSHERRIADLLSSRGTDPHVQN
ncbi:hypothetical protein [Mycoplana rhizolycopersici]|uniref:Transposase n=1 Tax=Mycoplana rhizolycopersici TaxID=2746702 RepID=A0ABX2QAZ1_9HYPH|nr:hypothetical protein [Rhizobium rhizolycopersici]NVP54491.1 hypothetical protein [Rhizobium rhizolycopersici]